MKFEVLAEFDVVVIGSGISGLLCALELGSHGKTVCILTKEAVTESASLYAQGGIAVPLSDADTFEDHLQDTLKAGAGLCNLEIAKEIINYSVIALEKLVSYGVRFDLNDNDHIHQTKEAAHSKPRVCHIGGDASGRFITKVLIDKACREPNISISQGTIVLSILSNDEGSASGVLVEDVTRSKYVILASDVIIATGGIGQLYLNTTNPLVSTGDGIVMAYRVGASLQDIEMVQFHPTVLLTNGEPFLITEAIRGEGAKLKNINGEYFARFYHRHSELAPRDILARAILNEMGKTMSRFVYLDVSNFSVDYFKNRFPTIYQCCQERKIDLFNVGIPVAPAVHYFIGGIKCDIYGATSVPSLWVVGEAACNGFHGANRLASNSLLECIVVPHFLVQKLMSKQSINKRRINWTSQGLDEKNYQENEIKEVIDQLKKKNTIALGLVRTESMLCEYLNWLNKMSCRFSIELLSTTYQVQELKNMILLSLLICLAALERKHSLGVHYREDYPEVPDEFKHSISQANKQLFWEMESTQKQPISF